MSLFNRLIINAASIYAARAFEGLLQLVLLAFILSRVGRQYYAAAILILSIEGTIELARGGMQKATVKYIAEFKAKGDYDKANGVLASSSALQGAVGFLGLLVCLGIAPYTTGLLALPASMQFEAQWATILLGIGVAVSFFISPWYNSVAANERYDLLSIATVSGKLFRALLIFSLLLLNAPNLVSLVCAAVSGIIVERMICILFAKRISSFLKFKLSNISSKKLKTICSYSFFDFFHTLSGFFYIQGSLFIAAHLISLNAVAALGIIGNITSLLNMVMSQFALMLVPVASRLQAQGSYGMLSKMVTQGTNLTVFSGGLIMACMVPWMEPFLAIWLGSSYMVLAPSCVILMSATFLVNSLTCIHNSLAGVGKVAVDGLSNSTCTFGGLLIGLILVTFLHAGLTGLVIGLLFARLSRFFFISWYGSSVFRIPYRRLIWFGYMRTYLLVAVISITGINLDFRISSWLHLIAAGTASGLCYLIIGNFFVIDSEVRKRFIDLFSELLNPKKNRKFFFQS